MCMYHTDTTADRPKPNRLMQRMATLLSYFVTLAEACRVYYYLYFCGGVLPKKEVWKLLCQSEVTVTKWGKWPKKGQHGGTGWTCLSVSVNGQPGHISVPLNAKRMSRRKWRTLQRDFEGTTLKVTGAYQLAREYRVPNTPKRIGTSVVLLLEGELLSILQEYVPDATFHVTVQTGGDTPGPFQTKGIAFTTPHQRRMARVVTSV